MITPKPINFTEIWVCEDCLFPLVNGDFSSLDYHYTVEEANKRSDEIVAGMKSLGHVYNGTEKEEFSRNTCDCCRTRLAGVRYQMFIEETETDGD